MNSFKTLLVMFAITNASVVFAAEPTQRNCPETMNCAIRVNNQVQQIQVPLAADTCLGTVAHFGSFTISAGILAQDVFISAKQNTTTISTDQTQEAYLRLEDGKNIGYFTCKVK